MPRTAIMVDASCELPQSLIEQLNIICVPNSVLVDNQIVIDDRLTVSSVDFFEREFDNGKTKADPVPAPPSDFLKWVRERAIHQCDHLLVITPLRALSKIYDNAQAGATSVATEVLQERMKNGNKEIFRVQLEDSRSLFAPHGSLAWEAALMAQQGEGINAIQPRIKELAPQAYGYYLPLNLKYLASRARDSKDKPSPIALALGTMLDIKPIIQRCGTASQTVAKVRGFEAAVGKLFQRLQLMMDRQELIVPRIVIGYGGDPSDLLQFDGFTQLQAHAQSRSVELAITPMSISAGVFLGRGAISVGVIAKPHEF